MLTSPGAPRATGGPVVGLRTRPDERPATRLCAGCRGDCSSRWVLPPVTRLRPAVQPDEVGCHYCASRDVVVVTSGALAVLLDGQSQIRWSAADRVGTAWAGLIERGVEQSVAARFATRGGRDLIIEVERMGRLILDDAYWLPRAAGVFAEYERVTGRRPSW